MQLLSLHNKDSNNKKEDVANYKEALKRGIIV